MTKLIFALTFCFSFSSFAESIRLFQNNRRLLNYEEKVRAIRPGDKLLFSERRSFVVSDVLFENDTIIVLKVSGERSLLIKKILSSSYHPINLFRGNFGAKKSKLLQLSEINSEKSIVEEFLVLNEVYSGFSLDEFLRGNFTSEKSEKELRSLFVDFAETLSEFSAISGFRKENVVFDGTQWRLRYFGPDILWATTVSDNTVFDYNLNTGNWAQDLDEELKASCIRRIKETRARPSFDFMGEGVFRNKNQCVQKVRKLN